MATVKAVPGFLPSVHGLHFANSFPPGPTLRFGLLDPRLVGIGDASAGLCGGMSVYVRDAYENARPIPPDTAPPANGSPLFKAIVRRQVISLDWLRGPVRFWWMGLRNAGWRRRHTLDSEWPRIRRSIDQGELALVGLVRHEGWNPWQLTGSHTVLAFAYSVADGTDPGLAPGTVTLRLYDSNWPNRDDVSVTLTPTAFSQSTGEPLRGVLSLG